VLSPGMEYRIKRARLTPSLNSAALPGSSLTNTRPYLTTSSHVCISSNHFTNLANNQTSQMSSTATHISFSGFLAFAFPSPFTCSLAARAERKQQRKLEKRITYTEKC